MDIFFLRIIFEICNELEVKPTLYSGRGMFGKQCLGFQIDEDCLGFAFRFGTNIANTFYKVTGLYSNPNINLKSDRLGHGFIVYVPEWECRQEIFDELMEEYENEEDDEIDDELVLAADDFSQNGTNLLQAMKKI